MSNKSDIFLLMLLSFIALILRLQWIFATGFNGLYGQDAYAYFDFAIELQHALIAWRWPEPFFWPLGYPSLLMLVFSIFGASAAVGQELNILLGSMLPMLVYVICRQLGCRLSGAFIGALLLAICGQAVQSSIVLMADIPALFWATLSAMGLIVYQRNKLSSRWLIVSAVLLAFAGITRWLYLSLAPIWALYVLLHWRGKIRWRDSFVVLGAVLLIFVPQFIYSWRNPFPSLNHEWVTNWSVSNMVTTQFSNVDGHFTYVYSNLRFYAAPVLNPYYLSPVFLCFVIFGLYMLFKKRDFLALMLLGFWMLIPLFFLAGIPTQNIRFPLIIFPAIVVLVGLGVDFVLSFEGNFRGLRIGLVGLICIFGVLHTFKTSEIIISDFIVRQEKSKEIAAWVQTQIPPDTTLYTFEITLTLEHETPFTIYDLFYETPETLAAKRARGQVEYALVNVWNLNHQWEGEAPYIAFYWLIEERGYRIIERYGNFTLLQLGE